MISLPGAIVMGSVFISRVILWAKNNLRRIVRTMEIASRIAHKHQPLHRNRKEKRRKVKFEPTNYKFEAVSFQIWAMFKDRTAAPVARAYKRAIDAERDAEEFAKGLRSCEYRRERIASFMICKVEINEIVRLKNDEVEKK